MKSKITIGIIICILVIAVIVEGMFIFNQSKKAKNGNDEDNKQEQTVEETPSPKPTSTAKTSPIPENEELTGENLTITKKYNEIEDDELVYTYLKAKVIEQDYEYTYEIPQINIESKDVEKINKEILEKYEEILSDMYKNQYLNFEAEGLEYKYYSNDDVLSLILIVDTEAGGTFGADIYNINIETGKKLTNKELIEAMDMTETELKNKLTDAIKKLDIYSDKEVDSDFVETQRNKTLKLYREKTINDISIYVNNAGNITAYLEVFSIAGGETMNCLVDLETGKILV